MGNPKFTVEGGNVIWHRMDRVGPQDCPDCKKPMIIMSSENTVLGFCAVCHGVFSLVKKA